MGRCFGKGVTSLCDRNTETTLTVLTERY